MRRLIGPAIGLGCVLALMLACFGQVLFGGEQFGYRDAAHYYYPLYQRVQQEWSKGHLPLWDARENAGMPLLGNPTAAVLYPGKVIFAMMPYPWAARMYIIAHVGLAFVGMYRLMARWQISREGSAFAAMAYAFGAPVLFQYCNVIYLVGAAWVPMGLSAVDSWLRSGRRASILTLGLVLAMQTLGGDPQEAYVTGLCAGGYALGLAVARARQRSGRPPMRARALGLLALTLVIVWTVVVLACAVYCPGLRPRRVVGAPRPPLEIWPAIRVGVMVGWGVAATVCLAMRRYGAKSLSTMFAGLAFAAILAGLVSAAQLLPIMEFTGMSDRAVEDGPHDIFPFSLEPVRLAEFVWPDVYGSNRLGNRSWSSLIPPRHSMEVWVPSLYLGGMTLVLALSAFNLRGDGARRVWLSWIAAVGLLASLGEFGGPLWVARCIRAPSHAVDDTPRDKADAPLKAARGVRSLASIIGPHDPVETLAIRSDGMLRDGDGSVYGLMATVLPGFGGFRYPSKMLTFVCVGVAGLAGIGLDRLVAGSSRRAARVAATFLVASVPLLIAWQLGRTSVVALLESRGAIKGVSPFGPFNAAGAWLETRSALLHGTAVFAASLAVVLIARRAPRFAAVSAVVLLTADLATVNARLIMTVPQSMFESMPEVLARIAEAEAVDPSPGPFRIHRMPYWDPIGWNETASPSRYRDMVRWERNTLQPKYGIPYEGVEYTMTEGVAELYDYRWFFSPFYGNRTNPNGPIDDATNPRLVYFPRRGFDLWNTRYFIVPAVNANNDKRAISSFLFETEPVAPRKEQLEGERGRAFLDAWMKSEDWRLVKNKNAFPRAWIVHRLDFRRELRGIRREGREEMIQEMVYLNDPFWTMSRMQVQDLREKAYVEVDDGSPLFRFVSHRQPDPEETATIVEPRDDQTVEIDVDLASNGFVVLADVLYPGWELTIDGRPATIYRANRMMRGALVEAGRHRLVYRYRPGSVRRGLLISCWGIGLTVLLAIAFRRRPHSPILSSKW